MSRTLAPIHNWLFNKILIHEELEKEIISRFSEQFGDEVYNIERDSIKKYGDRIPDAPLEEIIDTGNIHGWLQNKISVAETRQASILAELFKKYKNEGVQLVKDVYEKNGKRHGDNARNKYIVNSPSEIFDVINDYILDGMPCDNVNEIIKSDENYLEYIQTMCLHKGYWENAGVEPKIMYDLRATWNKAFVNAINPAFEYRVDNELNEGVEGFRYKILKNNPR